MPEEQEDPGAVWLLLVDDLLDYTRFVREHADESAEEVLMLFMEEYTTGFTPDELRDISDG